MPSRMVLEEVREPNFDGNEWRGKSEKLCPVVGMVDDPKNQKQLILRVHVLPEKTL